MTKLKAFLADESGATAIEYALIGAIISIAAVAAFSRAGSSLAADFNRVSSNLASAR